MTGMMIAAASRCAPASVSLVDVAVWAAVSGSGLPTARRPASAPTAPRPRRRTARPQFDITAAGTSPLRGDAGKVPG